MENNYIKWEIHKELRICYGQLLWMRDFITPTHFECKNNNEIKCLQPLEYAYIVSVFRSSVFISKSVYLFLSPPKGFLKGMSFFNSVKPHIYRPFNWAYNLYLI